MTQRGFITATTGFAIALLTLSVQAESSKETQSPSNSHFLQYGVSFVAENVASAADVCPTNSPVPCILGSGFGATVRVGYRSRGPWYIGGAYEFSHHDSSNLLRLAILQQLRVEGRYYLNQGARLTPYFEGGLGALIYGNEWGAKSGGPSASLGAGVEYQADESVVVGLAMSWRTLIFGNGRMVWADGVRTDTSDLGWVT